ncbi:MAG: hypothetical protein GF333_03155 [Candidatus Omnitrophica bacterium]|nr:hypothetical protein [Candidatus Omnitrophota bacterium]
MKKAVSILLAGILTASGISSASAAVVYLSSTRQIDLGGVTSEMYQVLKYDTFSGEASLFFDEFDPLNVLTGRDKQIDALHVLDEDNIILSTTRDVRFSEEEDEPWFKDGDVFRYTFSTGTAVLLFSQEHFTDAREDINALQYIDEDTLLLSVRGNAELGGLSFRDGDVVRYTLSTDTAELFFNEDSFLGNEDIDAFSMIDEQNILLSTQASATLGDLVFRDGDIIQYNLITGQASLFLSEDLISSPVDVDIDAFHFVAGTPVIPEPATFLLFLFGLFPLFRCRCRG